MCIDLYPRCPGVYATHPAPTSTEIHAPASPYAATFGNLLTLLVPRLYQNGFLVSGSTNLSHSSEIGPQSGEKCTDFFSFWGGPCGGPCGKGQEKLIVPFVLFLLDMVHAREKASTGSGWSWRVPHLRVHERLTRNVATTPSARNGASPSCWSGPCVQIGV